MKPVDTEALLVDEAAAAAKRRYRQKLYCFGAIGVASVVIIVVVLSVNLAKTKKATSSSPPLSPVHDDDLLVQTSYGPVLGFTYTSPPIPPSYSNATIQAWRGIPFAAAPIGNLRWQAPIEPAPWQDVRKAQTFASPCVQPDGSGSEDCLYLNIYKSKSSAPSSSPSSSARLPVFFYIYGGGLMSGQTGDDFSSLLYTLNDEATGAGAAVAAGGGVIVVEVAYRLNVFGFLATKALTQENQQQVAAGGSSGNYGILDQQQALRFVQANIGAFGGDAKRVVLCGQSSGGTSILALYSSPGSNGLFAGGISMSGSINISMPLAVTAEAQNQAQIVARTPCSSSSSSTIELACLRALNISFLASLVPYAWNMPGIWGLPKNTPLKGGQAYQGLVIVDGVCVTHAFADALAMGLVDVPLVFGNMQAEPDEDPDMDVRAYTDTQWQQLLNTTFTNWTFPSSSMTTNTKGGVAKHVHDLYAAESHVNVQLAYDEIVADYGLTCGSVYIASNACKGSSSSRRKSAIYLYENQWSLEHTFISVDYPGHVVQFAYHDTLYLMVTGQWTRFGNGTYIPTARDLQASYFLQSLFGTFLNTQNLNMFPLASPASSSSSSSVLPPAQIGPWLPFCSNSSVFVIQPQGSQSVTNHKQAVCSYLTSIGLDWPVFWWANRRRRV